VLQLPKHEYLCCVAKQTTIENDPRWRLVRMRDASADGSFFYSVKTTGVYCKPSCASRTALPRNVEFHATTDDAEHAGFRPCKRCQPTAPARAQRDKQMIATLCHWLAAQTKTPTLDELAAHAGVSKFHLQRMFKQITGVTPKAYAAALKRKQLPATITRAASVTDAIYASGHSSAGQFYASSNGVLGMTPTALRRGGATIHIQVAVTRCSLGSVLVAVTERGVCAILLGDADDELRIDLAARFPKATLVDGSTTAFRHLVQQVVALVDKPVADPSLPLDIQGTAFQQRVWLALRAIPLGTTVSYQQLANAIGAPTAARAVATACAANAIAVAIPCHRVVRSSGELSGYRWGVERKRALLTSEAKASKQSDAG
jgi:AraC family transcriptional regulator of adaptative response/methylated-DNA-[protein]-cysteine methyltransferase